MIRYLVLKVETVFDGLARFARDGCEALESIIATLVIILPAQRLLWYVICREINISRQVNLMLTIKASTSRAEIVWTHRLWMLWPSIWLAQLVVHKLLLSTMHYTFVIRGWWILWLAPMLSLPVWVLNSWLTLTIVCESRWIKLLFHHLSLTTLFDHTSVELVAILLLVTTSILDHHSILTLCIGCIFLTHCF